MNRWVVVLAGGVGSRFWPLSTPTRPKQLLPLVNSEPLLLNTLRRLEPIAGIERTLVLTNASLASAIMDVVPSLPPENIVAEPRPAGTAAALTWAASEIARRGGDDATMICVHADWAIADDDGFRETLLHAERVAITESALVTVGIVPTRPDPGFGYIQPGEEVESGAKVVTRFVEKPDRARAEWMLHEGYLWNSGIFVWQATDFLKEVRSVTPEVAGVLGAEQNDRPDLDTFFASVGVISVDVGVLERSKRVLVVPGDFGWDDVGTWAALRRVRPEDESGNVVSGSVHTKDATGNVVHADDGRVVLYGVSDLVVVSRGGVTLVTTTDMAADLKQLVDSLPPELREPG
ncbi:MAG TPA: sugar phosphate nucleotidyltransferase [Gemmatimonadaceae bacterium]|nr:sugar phosphate nucleotidyltransferase [Gemmatimonadaceae bacterium]